VGYPLLNCPRACRCLRSDIPQVKQNLVPKWAYTKEFHRLDEEFKLRQKQYFDNRHRVKPLPDIPDDTDVWVTTDGQPVTGRVVTHADAPRSYVVNTSNGSTIRRNRSQINVVPNSTPPSNSEPSEPIREPIMTRSRTGMKITPPQRL